MIFRGPHADVEIPDVSFSEYVLEGAEGLGGKAALIDGSNGRVITYGELVAGARALARGLGGKGLGKGEVVALFSPNVPEYALAFHGIAMAGGIVTTLNPLLKAEEVGRQLADAEARFVITVPALLGTVREAAGGTAVEEIFTIGEAEGATPLTALLASQGPAPRVEIDPGNDVVVMPYSSGTTGMPKGVMLTHRNLVANLVQTDPVEPCTEDEVASGILPFFHIYGMIVVMSLALRKGATVVTLPRFEQAAFLDSLQRYGVTRANLVPPIILALARHPLVDQYDLSRLRWITSGAAPLSAEVQQACAERIGCIVRQGYGLTETSPVTHTVPPPPAPQKPGTVGPPLPNTEVSIADLATGALLGPGEEGEVRVRGPQVMKGYFKNPGATRAMITEDGWLRTGDIGRCDEDGYLTIVDRAKEMIKYKGFQVAPAELEAVLLRHPAIADAAVIGVPDPEAGEVPKAFIVRSGEISEADVVAFLGKHVAPYKKVRQVAFVDSIPKSASGKILRRLLRG